MNSRYISCNLAFILAFSHIINAKISFKPDNIENKSEEDHLNQLVKELFPQENNLYVIQLDPNHDTPGEDKYIPNFHVPVVVYNEDQILRDCDGNKLQDYSGYVFKTSNSASIEVHLFPVLKCLNQTTLKIKTKFMLLVDSSKGRIPFDTYSTFFNNLWKTFGITNIAIHPINDQSTNAEMPLTIFYNPFFAHQHSNASALVINTGGLDLRRSMVDRFRNMQGYPLKTLLVNHNSLNIAAEDVTKSIRLGESPSLVFGQILKGYLNASLDVYMVVNYNTDRESMDKGTVTPIGEFLNGNADHCIPWALLDTKWTKHVQIIQIGQSYKYVFVVPKPRQVESWRLFLYLFQWEVSVGLGLTLLVLSGAAILFVIVLSRTNNGSDSLQATTQVVTVLKASISASINKLPENHSQRLLVAVSLLLGLIVITVLSARLFNLMKSRPEEGSIKSLRELQDSKLPIYLSTEMFIQALATLENTSLSELQKNVVHDGPYYNNWMNPQHLNITDRAILFIDYMINLLVNLPNSRRFSKYFEVINEAISESSYALIYPIGSLYYDSINDLNLILSAGGFYHKWYDALTKKHIEKFLKFPSKVAQPANDHGTDDDDKVPLAYDDLKLAFYILFIGLILATICFVTELFLKKLTTY